MEENSQGILNSSGVCLETWQSSRNTIRYEGYLLRVPRLQPFHRKKTKVGMSSAALVRLHVLLPMLSYCSVCGILQGVKVQGV